MLGGLLALLSAVGFAFEIATARRGVVTASVTQALSVTANSSNTSLIPNPSVTYVSPAATGSLKYTPLADQSGSAIITVTVRDAGLDGILGNSDDGTFFRTFTVAVTPVNDLPTLDAISDPSAIPQNAALQSINLSGITAGPNETQTLSVTAISNNTSLIPNPSVAYVSANSTGALSYTPDNMTDAMVRYLLLTQQPDGSWRTYDRRPPIQDGPIMGTALAARGARFTPTARIQELPGQGVEWATPAGTWRLGRPSWAAPETSSETGTSLSLDGAERLHLATEEALRPGVARMLGGLRDRGLEDRKSTRLNSSHRT